MVGHLSKSPVFFSVSLLCLPRGQHLAQIPQGGPSNICVVVPCQVPTTVKFIVFFFLNLLLQFYFKNLPTFFMCLSFLLSFPQPPTKPFWEAVHLEIRNK